MKCKCGNEVFYVKAVDYSKDFDAGSLDDNGLIKKIESGDYEPDFYKSEVSVFCKKCNAVIY